MLLGGHPVPVHRTVQLKVVLVGCDWHLASDGYADIDQTVNGGGVTGFDTPETSPFSTLQDTVRAVSTERRGGAVIDESGSAFDGGSRRLFWCFHSLPDEVPEHDAHSGQNGQENALPERVCRQELPDVPRHANDDVPPTANIHTGLAREFGISRETLYRYLKTKS